MQTSRKQNRGQLASSVERLWIGRSHGLEQRDDLLSRRLIIPFAVAAYNLQELVQGAFAVAACVQRQRQIVARLMVARVLSQLGLEDFRFAAGRLGGAVA